MNRDTANILNDALRTLGLTPGFLCNALGLPEGADKQWDSDSLTALQWVRICDALHLSYDCISYGYIYAVHKARLRAKWEDAELSLPRTPELKVLLTEIKADIKRDRRVQAARSGFRLRWGVRLRVGVTAFIQLPKMVLNESQVQRQSFLRQNVSNLQMAPVEVK